MTLLGAGVPTMMGDPEQLLCMYQASNGAPVRKFIVEELSGHVAVTLVHAWNWFHSEKSWQEEL